MTEATHRSRRGLARRLAIQALYQWLVNETDPDLMMAQFRDQPRGLGHADAEYFGMLVCGTIAQAQALEAQIIPLTDRPIEQLDPVEHAVLLLGAYELIYRQEVPWKVVLNEAVSLTKLFGAEDGFKFVNGVLDRLARTVRSSETGASASWTSLR